MANQGLAPRGPAPPICRRAGGRIRQTPALGGRTRVPPCSPALAMCDPSYSSSALFPRLGNGVTGPHSGSPRDRRCWGGRSTPPGTGGGLGTVWHTYHCGVLGSHPACLREAVTCPDLGSGAPRGGGRGRRAGPAGPGSPCPHCGLLSRVSSFGACQSLGEPWAPTQTRVWRRPRGGQTAEACGLRGLQGRTLSLSIQKPVPCPPPIPPPTTVTTLGHSGSSGLLARVQTSLCGRHPGSPWARILIWGVQPPPAQSWGIWPLSAHASVHPNVPQVPTAPGRQRQ